MQYDFLHFFSQLLGGDQQANWFLKNVFPFEVNNEMDRGIHEPAYFIEQQKQLWPDYREALDAFNKHYTDIFTKETDGMLPLMVDLKARGYRLLGLSNWSSKVYDVMHKFNIFDQLEGYLLSKDVHLLKPDPAIYRRFLQEFDVKSEECVFIDDKPENIDGSRSVGMHGIVFHNTAQLSHDLEPLLHD